MNTLGMTQSVCNVCRTPVPAKVLAGPDGVHLLKFCPAHGRSMDLVRSDADGYLRALRYVKPAWLPRAFAGSAHADCPTGCGLCTRHEQHLCMPIVEITSRCDLSCPACLVDAGGSWDMSEEQFKRVLDGLVAAEGQVDVLNLSGGEPLLHPRLPAIVDHALARKEIVRVSVSTNGLAMLREPGLLSALADRNVVVSLQFDGFDQRAYQVLRGRCLLDEKLRILDMLADRQAPTSLTVTAAGGVNDRQLPRIVEYLFSRRHVVSMMVQPLCFAGRGAGLSASAGRLTIPDVVKLLAGDRRVSADDFLPLPCSHPLCFSLAYYLVLQDGGTVSLSRLLDAATMMDCLANRTIFGLQADEHESLRQMVYDLWSGPAACAPDSQAVMDTLRGILQEVAGGCFDPRRAFTTAERHVKSIFIHAFQDAATFDLARVRRCCNAYPTGDGKLIPACVRNVLGRAGLGERK